MANIKVSFHPAWISKKEALPMTDNFCKILKFYIWDTPCEGISSCGVSMKERKWTDAIWKTSRDLRDYFLEVAELKKDITYSSAQSLEKMREAADKIGLSADAFYENRDRNRIVFYDDKKSNEILTIFFYIRCAFAHGRFEIYHEDNSTIYVMEAIKKNNSVFLSYARIILFEETMLQWIDIISSGEEKYKEIINQRLLILREKIKETISANVIKSKKKLCDILNDYSEKDVNEQLSYLQSLGEVIKQEQVYRIMDNIIPSDSTRSTIPANHQ